VRNARCLTLTRCQGVHWGQEVVPIHTEHTNTQLTEALVASASSTRLKAALAIGTKPDPGLLEVLVARCGVEPDFYVRDMLTWALTRLPPDLTVPRLLAELDSDVSQSRSQALHTLSKIGDVRAWPAMTSALLHDRDDEVARAVQLSLSRALVALGEIVEPVLKRAKESDAPAVAAHAAATERLLQDPDAAFELDIKEAKRVFALGKEG
jgi:HEAT repeat protein